MITPARVVDLDRQNKQLANYDHLERFGDRFLFPLARIYRVARECVVSILNDLGDIQTDRNDDELFTAAAHHCPELGRPVTSMGWGPGQDDLADLLALKPFYDTTRRLPATLPFDPSAPEAPALTARARNAARRLLGVAINVRAGVKR